MEIKIKTNDQLFNRAKEKLSPSQIAAAMRMAINDSLRKGRTMVRRSVQEGYNIKAGRLNDKDRQKGISTTIATNKKLEGRINVGHKPVSVADIKGTRIAIGKGRRAGGISVEIMKGRRKTINSAFVPGANIGSTINSRLIFARGKKGKPGFEFGKKRYPIDTISSVSVATAATNQKSLEIYEKPINDYAKERFVHHIERLIRGVDGLS